ncbi:MAG: HEPN domain-containing protein [Rhodocyclaceae bacterium]|nr:HEPN domain-containing protein [Rhodocyclaceae bacterium]
MSGELTPEALMTKVIRAIASARLLCADRDIDGACNRAYHAMFDAARAALLATNAPVPPDVGKTHGRLISAFSQHLVKHGPLSLDLGRSLNRAEEIRLVADYKGDSVEPEDAAEMIGQAEVFIVAICSALMPDFQSPLTPVELDGSASRQP